MNVDDIRAYLAEGHSVKEAAEHFGCTRQNIFLRIKADDEKKKRAAEGVTIQKVPRAEYDPATGLVVSMSPQNRNIIAKMGDDRVSAFVDYHMEMLAMRQGVDKRNVPDLYQRFLRYLEYCREHNIVPNNMNAYFAIGVARQDISAWHCGERGTKEHKEFADMLMSFFASIHEQGAIDGVMNPISAMFWQKAHDGLIEASKLEVINDDPLGDKRSAAEIAKAYTEVDLPD